MKKFRYFVGAAVLALSLAACSEEEEATTSANEETEQVAETEEAAATSVTYLGESYEVPAQINTIIAASLEAMEDAAVLGVKPAGVISNDGTTVPEYLQQELGDAVVVGSKKEPSAEAMLALQPDVILGTSKWDESQMANYNKVATTFPYSHISTNWRDNLTLFAELAGKEAEADKALADYDAQLKDVQAQVNDKGLTEKTALIIRVRGGLVVYPSGVYLNQSLYEDFGLKAPEQLSTIEAQTEITYETLAEWNPDLIILQYSTEEGEENAKVAEEILANDIFKSTNAAKNGEVYENIVDPMAQGGTAWSKIHFLKGFAETVLK